MTTTSLRADLLLSQRRDRIADELARSVTDGWLVYDFRGSNPAFSRLLGAGATHSSRRAFLYVPRHGEPRLLIHHVDAGNFSRLGLDVRPYGGRGEMLEELRALLNGARRILMEYSPGNAIPYVSRVDAGTLDVVRSLGVEVLSSADALASVVAAWDAADLASHERAARALERAKDGLFSAIKSHLGTPKSGPSSTLSSTSRASCWPTASNSTTRPSLRWAGTLAIHTMRRTPQSRFPFDQAILC